MDTDLTGTPVDYTGELDSLFARFEQATCLPEGSQDRAVATVDLHRALRLFAQDAVRVEQAGRIVDPNHWARAQDLMQALHEELLGVDGPAPDLREQAAQRVRQLGTRKPIVVAPLGAKVLAGGDVDVVFVEGRHANQVAALLYHFGEDEPETVEAILRLVDEAKATGSQIDRAGVEHVASMMRDGSHVNDVRLLWAERRLLLKLVGAMDTDAMADELEATGVDTDELVDKLLWQRYGCLNIPVDGGDELTWNLEA